MKKILLISLLACLNLNFFAQTYSLNVGNQPYQELTSPTDITGGNLWDDETWQLPLGFNMQLFDSSFSILSLNSNGFLFDSIGGVEIIIGMTRLDLVDGAFLIDFNNPIPITYKTEGNVGNQICKVQWKQANVWGQDSNNVVNYQIWLYEQTGNIEFRFDTLVLATMPTFSVQKLTTIPFFDDGISLLGNPSSPTTSNLINQQLNSVPITGTVYTFVRSVTANIQENNLLSWSFYPNPSNGIININNQKAELTNYHITALNGQQVLSNTIVAGKNKIDITSLAEGCYFLKVISTEGNVNTKKLIISY